MHLLLLPLLCLSLQAFAYPISPRPLRKLVMECEFIIVGHVDDIEERKKKEKDDYFGGYYAIVTVREVLKGSVTEVQLRIPFNPHMICPAPPWYEKNTDVIMFMNKGDDGYRTHALSYGVKTLDLAGLEAYKPRIAEIQQILSIADGDEQFIQTVEWLVKCAENPNTRYEGVYELSPESEFMSYYDRESPQPFKFGLTDDQKLRLKNALLASTEPGYVDFGLVDLVYATYKDEVYTHLLTSLKHVNDGNIWYADEYMSRLMLVKSSPRLEKLLEKFKERQFDYKQEDKLPGIVGEFVEEVEKL